MRTWQTARAAGVKILAAGSIIVRGTWSLLERLTGAQRRREAAVHEMLSRAQTLHQQGKLPQAMEAYRQLLSKAPAHFDALLLLGVLEVQRQNYPEGINLISRALQIRPTDALAWYHLGNGLFRLNQYEDAVASFDEAVRLRPDNAMFWKDRGGALRRLARLPEALDSYDQALKLNADYVEAHIGRGTTLHDLARVAEAMASFDRALAIRPDDGSALYNRAQCRLMLGDFNGGWPGFEWRDLGLRYRRENRLGLALRWRGEEPLAGKSILLWAEPGLGEAIQFCRFARLVAAKGATVLLHLALITRETARLQPLMESLEGPSQVLGADEKAPNTDYHCPLRSLPLALNIDLSNLPAERQYLYADRQRMAAWSAILGPRRLPRIGLVWSGNPSHSNDHNRSIPLQQFVQLAEGPFEFICLHKDVNETDLPLLEQRTDIRRFCDEQKNFGDAAALLQHMDLVIAVDTSVAHLAGALGRPVWVLLSFSPDWRWMRDREDSPWYPTVRLFRQPAIGDWRSVFAAVTRALAATTFPAEGPETTYAGSPRAERSEAPA